MDEVLLIDKPVGWTSFDVVAKIRGSIKARYVKAGIKPTKRQLRVGHAGTLDPFATGLLIVLLGESCKKAGEYLKLDKTYIFTAKLGEVSSTGDPEGSIEPVSSSIPTIGEVKSVINRFQGLIDQTPPAFSAIKINGKRAYSLARKGVEIEMPSRQVLVSKLNIVEYKYPYLKCECEVSSGTYIRSLVEDIGRELATGAYCEELRRTKIGKYDVSDARSVEDIINLVEKD